MNTEMRNKIIQIIIAHFKTINQHPDRHTVKIMVEVTGIIQGGDIQKAVYYMMDGKSNSVRFVYDHPRAYADFYSEFWRQWDAA